MFINPVRTSYVLRRLGAGLPRCCALLFMLGSLAGCAGGVGQTYVVPFVPLSSTPNVQGQAAMNAAIAYAKANPLMPVSIDGFYYGQSRADDVDTLRGQRVRLVESRLVEGGVSDARIQVLGKGLAYPHGSPMPAPPLDAVKIAIGL